MKDKLGITIVIICIVIAEAGGFYIWNSIMVEDMKQKLDEQTIDISGLNVSSKAGRLMFKIEQNETEFFGKSVYVGLFNPEDEEIPGEGPRFETIWKILVANETERDAQLLKELTLDKNYTVWYIDFVGFSKIEKHIRPRIDVLVDVIPID